MKRQKNLSLRVVTVIQCRHCNALFGGTNIPATETIPGSWVTLCPSCLNTTSVTKEQIIDMERINGHNENGRIRQRAGHGKKRVYTEK